MSTKDKWILPLAILVGLVLQGFVLGWSLGPSTDGVGAVVTGPNIENYVPAIQQNRGIRTAFDIYTSSGITVGANGGDLNELNSSTCNLSISATRLPFAASTTAPFNCAITGLASGDQVFVTLPAHTNFGAVNTTVHSFWVVAAAASSTAGQIDVWIYNGTGTATSSFVQATTSVQVWSADN